MVIQAAKPLSHAGKDYYEWYWSADGYAHRGMEKPALVGLFQEYVSSGSKCFELGCGDGRTSGLYLRDHGCEYVGLDVSTSAVRAAKDLGLDARRIEDGESLPFPDSSFDVAVCTQVMEHLYHPQLAAADILRVLRPGGVLIATVPNVAYWRRRLDLALFGRWNPLGDEFAVAQPWRDPHIRFFNPGSLKRMLSSVGFSPVKVGGHGGGLLQDTPWVGRKLSKGANSRIYRLGERVFPSFFAYRLHCVAIKPGEA
jgi:SAM-dependent methyltransferase